MANYRGGRINEEVRKEVSDIIINNIKEINDISKIYTDKDLRYAKIFVSVFSNNEEEKNNSFLALKNSAGFVRKELGHRINLRYTPEVLFELDNSIDKGMHIDSLLQKIKEK